MGWLSLSNDFNVSGDKGESWRGIEPPELHGANGEQGGSFGLISPN